MSKQLTNIKALGKRVTKFTRFDTFPTPLGVSRVQCISDEVTANCPVTEQPDWYVVTISYGPNALCVESKTLKLYLQSFRNDGRFCEAFASVIASDLMNALSPRWIEVEVKQKARGGVSIVSTAALSET